MQKKILTALASIIIIITGFYIISLQHKTCDKSSINIFTGKLSENCKSKSANLQKQFYSAPNNTTTNPVKLLTKPWLFPSAEKVRLPGHSKNITEFPSDGYGKYLSCTATELKYLSVPTIFATKKENICTEGAQNIYKNMKDHLSNNCFNFINNLINISAAAKDPDICNNKNGRLKIGTIIQKQAHKEKQMLVPVWQHRKNQKLFQYPLTIDTSLKPYPNSNGYYPITTDMKQLIASKNGNAIRSQPGGYIYQNLPFYFTDKKFKNKNYINQRRIDWAFPATGCAKKGCPALIILAGGGSQYEDWFTTSEKAYKNKTFTSCASNPFSNKWYWPEKDGNPHGGGQGFDGVRAFSYGYYARMNLIKAALAKGYAVIFLNPWPVAKAKQWDDWAFSPNSCPQQKSNSSYKNYWKTSDSGVWPGVDKAFMYHFFNDLIKNYRQKNHATNNKLFLSNKKIDLNNIFMLGYSSGGHMVSRMINEFATPTTQKNCPSKEQQFTQEKGCYWLPTIDNKPANNKNTLKIRGAILLASGSYYDYSECPGTYPNSSYIKGGNTCLECKYDAKRCRSVSNNYKISQILIGGGCASPSLLEKNYQTDSLQLKNMSEHPPVLLAQSNFDDFADRDVSRFYYLLMKSNKNSSKNVYRISSNHPYTGHIYFPEMVIPTINFMQKYRKDNISPENNR